MFKLTSWEEGLLPRNDPCLKMLENISDFLLASDWFIFNNYSPKAKLILSSNPRDEVEGIIRQYSLSLRGIIVLV